MIFAIIYCIITTVIFGIIGVNLIINGFKENWYKCTTGLIIIIVAFFGNYCATSYIDETKQTEIKEVEESVEASWGTKQLNIDNLYEELLNQELDFPEIVLAQALLETGHFESFSCRERNNLFGLRKRDGSYMVFPHWTYSVAAYKKYIQKYKETPEDYYKFLENLGYAEDSAYIEKVKQTHKKYVKK